MNKFFSLAKKILPFILLFILAFYLIYEATSDTPTYDEPANMAASFDYVYRNDFRLYPDNPPFVKILAGLALFPIAKNINFPTSLAVYNNPEQFDLYKFGTSYLFQSGNPTRAIIFLSRLPNMLITILLVIILYLTAKKLYGQNAGLFALFLFILDPNIRGHGHILAFDIPLAFITLFIFYLTLLFLEKENRRQFIGSVLIILFSLGYLTKFTFVFFVLFYFTVFLLYLKNQKGNKRNLLTFLASLIILPSIFLWLFAIKTGYNKPTLDYSKLPIIKSAEIKYKNGISWQALKTLPLPYFMRAGMQTMYTHNDVVGEPPAFLLGKVHAKNDWFFYFPISFLLKTPLPTQMAIFITLFYLFYSFHSHTSLAKSQNKSAPFFKNYSHNSIFYLLPFVFAFYFMLCLMIFSHINNVYRYLFPSLIFLILGASQIVNLINFRKHSVKILFILNCIFLILTSFLSFPLDLSYTNELTGIPPKGYKYLSDSEVDWGQDLERLGLLLKEKKMDDKLITLSYLGTSDPAFYGIKYKTLQFKDLSSLKGIVAVSVGNLTLGDWQWTSRPGYQAGMEKAPLDFLRSRAPDFVVGKSIFVYKF